MMASWQSLDEPIRIGSLIAKNRVEAAPTLTCTANADQSVSSDLVEFYRAQAEGGAGIITVLETAVDSDRAVTQPTQLNLGSDLFIPGLSELAQTIKSQGALASIQLNHGGRQAVSELNGGRNPIGPSAMVGVFTEDRRRGEQVVEEMSLAMIDEVVDHYAAAAFRAKTAGFDMVMVHAGHGWLISQFISPAVNRRSDEYGGSLENRARFGFRIAEAIRRRCGADFPIEWRISASDLVPGGMEIEDAIEYAQLMQDKVDCFQVSAGMIAEPRTYPYTHPSVYLPHGENVDRAAQIKKAVNKPVGVVGAILDLDEAGRWVAEGKIDFVALCRALLADPALPKKTFGGRKEDIVPCVRCNACLVRGAHSERVLCAVNPWSVRENYYRGLEPPAKKKRVVVVGGGPAGMEAAIVASSRGHDVTLFEKEDRLGGNLWISSGPGFKDDWKKFLRYLLRQVENSTVRVRLNTPATQSLVRAEEPDEVIVAAGAEPVWPDVVGIKSPNVVWAGDVLAGRQVYGDQVVVAGTGGMGCETALHLARQGKQVTLIDIPGGSDHDQTVNFVDMMALEDMLREYRVAIQKELVLDRVLYARVAVCDACGQPEGIAAQAVVVAPSLRARESVVRRLTGSAAEIRVVGDCKAPRVLFNAVHEGFEAALEL